MHYEQIIKSYTNIENVVSIIGTKQKRNRDIIEAYRFHLKGYIFEIYIPKGFPYELPIFYLTTPIMHPHVDSNGYVCIDRIEDIDYKPDHEDDIILRSISSVENIFSMDDHRKDIEYLTEYNDYLRNNDKWDNSLNYYICSNLSKVSEPNLLVMRITNKCAYIAFNDDELRQKYLLDTKTDEPTKKYCIYVPLEYAPKLPLTYTSSWQIKTIVDCISAENKKKLAKIHLRALNQIYLFSYINPQGDNNYFGVTIEKTKSDIKNSLISSSTTVKSIYTPQKIYTEYLRKRGSSTTLQQQILVIGCGSLGSETIYHLAKAGFVNITLCDDDLLSPNNIYRHFLGIDYALYIDSDLNVHQFRKVDALKSEFERRYPDLHINIVNQRIEDAISDNNININKFDFMISTTGNQISNRFLNRLLYSSDRNTKGVFAWLEPYGIGHHILFVDPNAKGCLNCFLSDARRITFASNDDYIIHCDTCVGSYTEFGAIAISKCAIDIVEQLTYISLGFAIFENMHICTKNNSDLFLQAGFKTTKYYELNEVELHRMRYDYFEEGCGICGRHHNII